MLYIDQHKSLSLGFFKTPIGVGYPSMYPVGGGHLTPLKHLENSDPNFF